MCTMCVAVCSKLVAYDHVLFLEKVTLMSHLFNISGFSRLYNEQASLIFYTALLQIS